VLEDKSVSNGRHNIVLSELQVTAWRFVRWGKGGSYGNIVVGKVKMVELSLPSP
jgi:hypothetical protein